MILLLCGQSLRVTMSPGSVSIEAEEKDKIPAKPSLTRSSSLLSYKKFLERKTDGSASPASSPDTSASSDSYRLASHLYMDSDSASFYLSTMERENNDGSGTRASGYFEGTQSGEPEIFEESVVSFDCEIKNRQLIHENKMLREENAGFAAQLIYVQRSMKTAEQHRLLAEEQLARALTQYHALGERLQRMEESWRERGEGQKMLELELEQAQQAVDAKEDALKKAQEEFERLQHVCQSLEDDKEELTYAVETRISELEDAMKQLNEQYDNAVSHYNSLCDAVDSANKIVDDTREELQTCKARIVQLEDELNDKVAGINDLRAQLDEAGRNRDALLNMSFYQPGSALKSSLTTDGLFSESPGVYGRENGLRRQCFTSNSVVENISMRNLDVDESLVPLFRLSFDDTVAASDDSITDPSDVHGDALCRHPDEKNTNISSSNSTLSFALMSPPVSSVRSAADITELTSVLSKSSSKTLHDELMEIEQSNKSVKNTTDNCVSSSDTVVIKDSALSTATSELVVKVKPSHMELTPKKSLRKALRFGRYAAIFGVCIAYHYIVLILSSGVLFESISVSHVGDQPPAW